MEQNKDKAARSGDILSVLSPIRKGSDDSAFPAFPRCPVHAAGFCIQEYDEMLTSLQLLGSKVKGFLGTSIISRVPESSGIAPSHVQC